MYLRDHQIVERADFSLDLNSSRFSQSPGCFETLLVKNQTPLFFQEHLKRAYKTLTLFFKILPPSISFDVWAKPFYSSIKDFILKSPIKEKPSRLKILFFLEKNHPLSFVATLSSLDTFPPSLSLKSFWDREGLFSSSQCEHKTLNYRPHQKMREDAQNFNFDDALRISSQGHILETSKANVFFINNQNEILTPSIKGLLPGILRQWLIDQEELKILERPIESSELPFFSSSFVTNSIVEVLPVERIDDHQFPIDHSLIEKIRSLIEARVY